jgi:hypothetical protein
MSCMSWPYFSRCSSYVRRPWRRRWPAWAALLVYCSQFVAIPCLKNRMMSPFFAYWCLASMIVIASCVVSLLRCITSCHFILDWVHGFKSRPSAFNLPTVLPCQSMATLKALRHTPHPSPLLMSTRHMASVLRTSPIRQIIVLQVNLSLNCRRMPADWSSSTCRTGGRPHTNSEFE